VLRYWYRENGAWKHTGLLNYSGPQTLSLGDAIDEVRIHPAGALMTTFTYQPLVGMTSATDPNNKVSYYEYDSYGRLKYVRDEEHNILGAYQYHYQVR
jgi:YD repeat-containing protein